MNNLLTQDLATKSGSENSSHSTTNNEFIRKVFEPKNIDSLLSEIGLPGLDVTKDQEKFDTYNRTSIKFRLSRDGNPANSKILIDVSTGTPSFDVLYDTVYGFGSDCRSRIILFREEDKDAPQWHQNMLARMITNLNQYNTGICLSRVEVTSGELAYELLVHPTGESISSKDTYPTRERFMEAEFWVRYYGREELNDEFPECDFDFRTEFGEWMWLNGVKVEVHWTERGAVFLATEEDSKNGFLRTIWEKHEHEIMSSFKRGEVKYSIVAGELPKISVQVWYDPISDLIGSSSDEKKAYGDLLYAKFHRFSEMVDGYLWDIKKMSN